MDGVFPTDEHFVMVSKIQPGDRVRVLDISSDLMYRHGVYYGLMETSYSEGEYVAVVRLDDEKLLRPFHYSRVVPA